MCLLQLSGGGCTTYARRQLTASDINFAIVRPLVFKYSKLDNMAIVYACFVVRSHFLSEADDNLAFSGVLLSRAALCEILAMKLLGTFASSPLRVATVLTASWNPLAGAPEGIIDEVKSMVGMDGSYDPQCALEVRLRQRPYRIYLTYSSSCIVDGNCYRIQSIPSLALGTNSRERYLFGPNGLLDDVKTFCPRRQLQAT